MPDFIVIDEMQNYNALLTYFIDLRDNKKDSFVYRDNTLLQKIAETNFVNERNVQPILFEKAYEYKGDIGKIFKNIFTGKHKIDLDSIKTFEDLFDNKDAIKYIILSEEIVFNSLITNKILFSKMFEGSALEAVEDLGYERSLKIGLTNYKNFFINENYLKDIVMINKNGINYLVNLLEDISSIDGSYRTILFNNVDFRTRVLERHTIDYTNGDYFKEYFEINESITNIGSTTFIKDLNFLNCGRLILRPLNCVNKNNLNFKFCGYRDFYPQNVVKVSINDTVSTITVDNFRNSTVSYNSNGFPANMASINIPIANMNEKTRIWICDSNVSNQVYGRPMRYIMPYSLSLT